MKIRLSLLIPALLIMSALISSAAMFVLQSRDANQNIKRDGINEINTVLTHLQNVLNTQLTKDNYEDAKVSISVSALHSGVRNVVLVDTDSSVVLSSRYILVGDQATLVSGYDPLIADEVRRTLTTKISMLLDKPILQGYCPVILKLGMTGTGSDLIGVLFVEYDLSFKFAQARQNVLLQVSAFAGLVITFSLLMALFMHLRITRRVGQMVAVADEYALGNYAARVDLKGRDELSELSSALNAMAEQRLLAESKLRLTARVFETTLEAILVTDADTRILDVNAAFTRITGYRREDVLAKTPRILKSERHDHAFYEAMWQSLVATRHWSGEIWDRKKTGEIYPAWCNISSIVDESGVVTHYVGIFSDISVLKQHESRLEYIAHHDALTGIPNRALLADRMTQAIAQSKRNKKVLAVCYIDLDGFKPINDTLGHEAGDRMLIEIAGRIGQTIRGGDTLARLGGDEFVLLLLGMEKIEECTNKLGGLLEVIAQPVVIGGRRLSVTASIGVTFSPHDDDQPDGLLRHADQAMYIAKQSGRNRYHIYDSEQDQRTRTHRESLLRIKKALENNEFVLYYQPKVDMQSNRVVGAEALIRWRHPERGLLPPKEFLPLIENSELEIDVGEWVIATALAQLAAWQDQGIDIEVSINIAAGHLQADNFVDRLRKSLSRYPGLPDSRLQIEILETAALHDFSKVSKIIEACRGVGVSFALDDFGTGYSSLTYLRSLPVETLKIDQSFVRNMLVDKGDCAIVEAVIALAETFDRIIVAEGVETMAHFQALLDRQCQIGQGFGIAKPMAAEDFVWWSKARASSLDTMQ